MSLIVLNVFHHSVLQEDPYLESPESKDVATQSASKISENPEPKEPKLVSRGTQLHSRNLDWKYTKSSLTRVCPQCFVTFAPDVDPRVYEEHMVFHERYPKKYN